ncbi:MAG: hypothetical protein AAGD07_08420 [Planctomycetota bacterium]
MSPEDARGLLASLTVAWHPSLLGAIGKSPQWYPAEEPPSFLADGLPEDDAATTGEAVKGDTLVFVSDAARKKMPDDFAGLVLDEPDAAESEVETATLSRTVWVPVSDREQACQRLAEIATAAGLDWQPHALTDPDSGRSVTEADFFALGYCWWQVQVLTRRLRYTCHLDVGYFEGRLVESAKAFINKQTSACIEAMHDCFDGLAEERDHYFASDPSLIDLTLLTPGTLAQWLPLSATHAQESARCDSILATPTNALVDESVAQHVLEQPAAIRGEFREAFATPDLGWAGGGPAAEVCFEALTIDEGECALRQALQTVADAVGASTRVYGRLSGTTPPELLAATKASGCIGVVPIDFVGGSGFGDESKVVFSVGGTEMEALTAKPIDADDDASFLTLGTRLGQAIDAGEIATGLMVHWPGGGCQSFHDLKRACTWSIALGRFWRMQDYFESGEHPYHHGTAPKSSLNPAACAEALREVPQQLQDQIGRQQGRDLDAIACLVDAKRSSAPEPNKSVSVPDAARRLSSALGYRHCDSNEEAGKASETGGHPGLVTLNAAPVASRSRVMLSGTAAIEGENVYSRSNIDGKSSVLLDCPAWGFASHQLAGDHVTPLANPEVAEGHESSRDRKSHALASPWKLSMKRVAASILRRPQPLFHEGVLANEFLDVVFDPTAGGLKGVHSGPSRGNRFSSRLVVPTGKGDDASIAVCDSIKVVRNDPLSAEVQTSGSLTAELATHGTARWTWTADYALTRGQRVLEVRLSLQAANEAANAWWQRKDRPTGCPSWRVAVADPTPIVRSFAREQARRISTRQWISPLGYLLQEDEQSTLIGTQGSAWHRKVGDRFFDTVLLRESTHLQIGFDVPSPIQQAPALLRPAKCMGVQGVEKPSRGWLMHVSVPTVTAQMVGSAVDTKGNVLMHLRLIQTAAKTTKVNLQFCRSATSVVSLSPLTRPLEAMTNEATMETESVAICEGDPWESSKIEGEVLCENGSIAVTLGTHEVRHLGIRFSSKL